MDLDFVVVGAGIAGASAAYELAAANSVLLLEQEHQPGYHTTGRSAALYAEIYGNQTVRALTTGGKEFYLRPPAGLLGHTKIESTVRYLGIEVDDALTIAEQVDV